MTGLEATAAHEAGHLAMTIVTGERPVGAQVDGQRAAGVAFYARTPFMPEVETARRSAMISLAGPLAEGTRPSWPLGTTGDEQGVAEGVATIAGNRRDRAEVFRELVADAEHTAGRDVYRRLQVAFTHALEQHGQLDQRGIARVCKAVARSLDDKDERRGEDVMANSKLRAEHRRDLKRFLDGLTKAMSSTTAPSISTTTRANDPEGRPPITVKALKC